MNEETLVKLAQEGDKEAMRVLFDDNKKKIFHMAYHYVQNVEDAEDILQETFIKTFTSLDKYSYHSGASFSTWLYRIGTNCSIDHLRKNKKGKDTYGMDNLSSIPSKNENSDPEYKSRLKEARERIEVFLSKLSARQRMIFILKHYQQLTTKEIAEYFNCTEGSIKKQLFRAVEEIKKHFKDFFTENGYEMQKI
ncbi:MAG: RNA polymerase sigma factor [Candidatus Aminicenantaceae bacterium]